jgi:peptidyl-prolyl cis-trans isomerase D
MAIISKIQKHAYILVAIIAIALLTFLFEYINPNLNALRNGANFIGKVNGETLKYEQYKTEFDAKEKELRASKGGKNPSEQELEAIKNQIWGNFLVTNVITKTMSKLGLETSPAELVEITTGQNIDPSLMQIPAFKNQMGQYDPMLFKNFLKTLNQDEPNTPPGARRKQWVEFENQIKSNRKMTKFNSLIENAMYVPKWLNDYETKLFATTADLNYVVMPYSAVDVDKLNYEKKELEDYFSIHKNKYIPEQPTVKISNVVFKLQPSFEDSVEIMNKFAVKIEDMRTAKNDTSFFKAYGDKGFDIYFYKRDELVANPQVEQLFATSAGGIVGPYMTKDNVNAIKVLSRRNISDSVFVQPITISFKDVMQSQEGINKRLKLVDSIFKMLDTFNMDFNQIAGQYSADRGQAPAMWIARSENTWNPEVFFYGGTKRYFKSPSDREGVVRSSFNSVCAIH